MLGPDFKVEIEGVANPNFLASLNPIDDELDAEESVDAATELVRTDFVQSLDGDSLKKKFDFKKRLLESGLQVDFNEAQFLFAKLKCADLFNGMLDFVSEHQEGPYIFEMWVKLLLDLLHDWRYKVALAEAHLEGENEWCEYVPDVDDVCIDSDDLPLEYRATLIAVLETAREFECCPIAFDALCDVSIAQHEAGVFTLATTCLAQPGNAHRLETFRDFTVYAPVVADLLFALSDIYRDDEEAFGHVSRYVETLYLDASPQLCEFMLAAKVIYEDNLELFEEISDLALYVYVMGGEESLALFRRIFNGRPENFADEALEGHSEKPAFADDMSVLQMFAKLAVDLHEGAFIVLAKAYEALEHDRPKFITFYNTYLLNNLDDPPFAWSSFQTQSNDVENPLASSIDSFAAFVEYRGDAAAYLLGRLAYVFEGVLPNDDLVDLVDRSCGMLSDKALILLADLAFMLYEEEGQPDRDRFFELRDIVQDIDTTLLNIHGPADDETIVLGEFDSLLAAREMYEGDLDLFRQVASVFVYKNGAYIEIIERAHQFLQDDDAFRYVLDLYFTQTDGPRAITKLIARLSRRVESGEYESNVLDGGQQFSYAVH